MHRRNLLLTFLSLALTAVHTHSDGQIDRYRTGVREPTPEEWQIIQGNLVPHTPAATRDTLPARHVNHLFLPPVAEQGAPNCYVFHVCYYYKTWQEAKEHDWQKPSVEVDPEHIMSPAFPYPLTSGGDEDGGSTAMAISTINRFGCTTWAEMPGPGSYRDFPPDDRWEKALPYRGQGTGSIDLSTAAGIEQLKLHLADGDLAVVDVPIFSATSSHLGNLVDNDVIYGDTGSAVSGHVVTIIGYDDTVTYHNGVEERSGAFLFVNSWRQDWGVSVPEVGTRGFGWFAYDFFTDFLSNYGSYKTAWIMYDRTDYQPEKLARISIDTESRKFLVFNIEATKPDGETTSLPAFPYAGGNLPYDGEITVDITDFGRGFSQYGLRISKNTNADVTIRKFGIEIEGGRSFQAPDLPMTYWSSEWGGIIYAGSMIQAPQWEPLVTGALYPETTTAGTRCIDFDGDGDLDVSLCTSIWDETARGSWEKRALIILRDASGQLSQTLELSQDAAEAST